MPYSVLKPFVTSDICLTCDGCCRFKEANSDWRPRFSTEEIRESRRQGGLAEEILTKVSNDGRIESTPCRGEHACSFFKNEDQTCGIYTKRPFECQLYPFIINKKEDQSVVSVHLNCPFVQEKIHTEHFSQYVDYLKRVFADPQMIAYVNQNPEIVGDYESYQDELEYLFKVNSPLDRNEGLLSKKKWVEFFLRAESHELSSCSFVNLFVWGGFFDFSFELIDGNLCIFAHHQLGSFLYLPPLGAETQVRTIEQCFERMDVLNRLSAVSRVENIPESKLNLFPEEQFSFFKKAPEFVYRRQDIAGLKGGEYKSKRSSFNQFARRPDYRFIPFAESMAETCLKLYEKWMQERSSKNNDPVYVQMLDDSRSAHERGLKYFKELGLVGRVVTIDGEIKGYTFGYPLNREVFCVLFEVADLSVKGLATYIFSRFCSDPELEGYQFINVMDDFELKNIETTKLSFRPVRLISSYTVSRKGLSERI